MAEIKNIDITGEELARRVRVVLEYAITESEAMMNQELAKRIAEAVAKDWIKANKKKMMAQLKIDAVAKEVVHAIVAKAVFNLAVENANGC